APPRSPRLSAHATGAPYCNSPRQMAGHPPAAAPDDTPPQQAGGGDDSISSVADRPVLGGPRLNTQDTALLLGVRSELCEFPVLLEYKIHCLDTTGPGDSDHQPVHVCAQRRHSPLRGAPPRQTTKTIRCQHDTAFPSLSTHPRRHSPPCARLFLVMTTDR